MKYRVSQRDYSRFVPLEPDKRLSPRPAQPIHERTRFFFRYFFPILTSLYLLAFVPFPGQGCFILDLKIFCQGLKVPFDAPFP